MRGFGRLDVIMTSAAADFPANYAESRKRFIARVAGLAGPKEPGRWEVPSRRSEDLSVDWVFLPATQEPRTLVVITSGVHGSEAYAGSACLEMFFREILPLVDRRGVGLFLAHAMNPYGFKHHSRCTESHVNLNRNFSPDGSIYRLRNEESLRLCERFLSKEPVSSLRARLIEVMKAENGTVTFEGVTLDRLIKATAPGQFERPEYVEYGGRGPEPQTAAFIAKMREILPPYRDVLGLDLHTGLGHRGRLHLLTGGAEIATHPELFAKIFHAEADREFYELTPPEADGFYDVHGCLNNVFGELAGPHQRACGITMEYGTLGHGFEAQIDGLNRSLLEIQGAHHGFADQELERQARALAFERSYPDDDEWRASVVRAARGLFERVFARAVGA